MKKVVLLLLTAVFTLGGQQLPASSSRDKLFLLKKKQNGKCRLSMMRLYEYLKAYHAKNNCFPKYNNYAGLKELVKSGALPGDFVCDAYRGKKAKKTQELKESTMPFLYFGGVNYTQAQRVCPTIPLLCDKPDSRHLNVLLVDGNIITVDLKRIKRKISNCQDIVDVLDSMYAYPSDILETLRVKAKSMDELLSKK